MNDEQIEQAFIVSLEGQNAKDIAAILRTYPHIAVAIIIKLVNKIDRLEYELELAKDDSSNARTNVSDERSEQ